MSFTVEGFKNPIEASYVSGFKLQTAILYGEDFYVVDEDEASLTVAEYATLSSPTVTVIDEDSESAGMIQEMNDMQLDFFLPVPLNAGCKVRIVLPPQYSVETVETVLTKNAFGSMQTFNEFPLGNLSKDPSLRTLSLRDACPGYIENDRVATIQLKSLR